MLGNCCSSNNGDSSDLIVGITLAAIGNSTEVVVCMLAGRSWCHFLLFAQKVEEIPYNSPYEQKAQNGGIDDRAADGMDVKEETKSNPYDIENTYDQRNIALSYPIEACQSNAA